MLTQTLERQTTWLDDRLTLGKSSKKLLNKIFPDHWSFMLGEIALYSFIILVLTGVFLTLYFIPSAAQVVYHGPYKPLDGQRVSEAYASTIDLSFSVRFGLVMRQMHHWAADVFIGAIAVHMCRIFFTGAFRRPRELNWAVGVTLLMLAIVNGFLGYSLPDDLVSGTGLRIAFSILLSVPVVGTYLAFFVFGGNFPGTSIIPRFFILHVLIIPAVIAGLIAAHLGMMVHQKHTQFRGKGATEKNVVGSVAWPTYAFKTLGYFFLTAAVLAGLAGLAQINPIWQYGPFIPYHVSYAVQPDWYMGWLDGALRIFPSWETVAFGHMIPTIFYPAVLFPGITFTVFYAWPFIEDHFTHESRQEHHLLDRPRDRPLRTAIGSGVLAFYFLLFSASATDVLANFFGISLNIVLWSFRILVPTVPIIVGFVAHRICKELQTWEDVGERKRPTIILRSADGSYVGTTADYRPGDEPRELEPEPVPEAVGAHANGASTPELVGAGAGLAAPSQASAVPSGVLQAPRAPRNFDGGGGFLSNLRPRRQRD